MRFGRLSFDSFAAVRRRMIRETEEALLAALVSKERVPPIPMMEVGYGKFRPEFAEMYWKHTLGLTDEQWAAYQRRPGDDSQIARLLADRLHFRPPNGQ